LTLFDIAQRINRAAAGYRMREFQYLRRDLHGKRNVPSTQIFDHRTVADTWAFHVGGRRELQYNIGIEGVDGVDHLRHGVAFSLEASQTLPDVFVLVPKIERLNDYMRVHAEPFEDMRLWHWRGDQRSPDRPAGPIPADLVEPGTFIFLGKRQPLADWRADVVLQDFDRLLDVYTYVEGDGELLTSPDAAEGGFDFQPGCPEMSDATNASYAERRVSVSLHHHYLARQVYEALCAEHGAANVGVENSTGVGTRIDIVVRLSRGVFSFYEIKTGTCVRRCIREALPQLLEYAFWPGTERARELVIVSENSLTLDAEEYLRTLRTDLSIPVWHRQWDDGLGHLGPALPCGEHSTRCG